MKHTHLIFLTALLATLVSGWCGAKPNDGNVLSPPFAKQGAPKRLPVGTEKEVTFYPTYAYKDAQGWNINLRGFVHKDESLANLGLGAFNKCTEAEKANFRAQADLLDDEKDNEEVFIKFASDPEDRPYKFPRGGSDGIVKLSFVLSDEQATRLLAQQNSSNGWLTYSSPVTAAFLKERFT